MIEFKKNIKELLPYNRKQYLEFLSGDFDSPSEWYGVSFQLDMGEKKNKFNRICSKI